MRVGESMASGWRCPEPNTLLFSLVRVLETATAGLLEERLALFVGFQVQRVPHDDRHEQVIDIRAVSTEYAPGSHFSSRRQ